MSETPTTTSLPIGAGLAAACAVLGLGCVIILVWCVCLKCNGGRPQSWKISSYKHNQVVPVRRPPAVPVQLPFHPASRSQLPPPLHAQPEQSRSEPRIVSLKDRQEALAKKCDADQELIVQRMQSVMDDSVRIDVHYQEQQRRAKEATRDKRSRKKQLSESSIAL